MPPWTVDDIPDQTGRTVVITGSNTGLGYETALALARRGATVAMAVRNTEKGEAAAARLREAVPDARVSVQHLDLSSLESIRAAARMLRDDHQRIDLLVNNAGVMMTPRGTTEDGFELQIGTNHFGHFALTGLLLDRLLDTPGARVVTVSSQGHRMGGLDFADLQSQRRYHRVLAYGRAKLANLLFTYELQRRLRGRDLLAVAAHPGGSNSDLARHLPGVFGLLTRPFMQPAAAGALPTLRAATDPSVLGGQYYGPDGIGEMRGHPKVVGSSGASHDVVAQRRLWEESVRLTGVGYDALG